MRVLGEICLFVSMAATGYAAFLSLWRGRRQSCLQQRIVIFASSVGLGALTIAMGLLIWALVSRDFRFEYVAQYVSRFLPWRYSLSALWVGQAGSLLLWTWMTAVIAILLRVLPTIDIHLRNTTFGLLMANVFFLLVVVVFAADPMAPSLIAANEGAGLSPLLQDPSMLIHPPIVFLAYSVWAVPCALALAALSTGTLDTTWTHMARPWALLAWTLLGVGLLLGAHWAYHELGWGGYWGWDPVENGSLMPWLTGTALIHSLMMWRHRGVLKKTAIFLAIITFALCNFATFLTRSGIFSSVHAFSESPIGWMFLGLMFALVGGGATMVVQRRHLLVGRPLIRTLLARETLIVVSLFLILSLTVVILVGTLVGPVSKMYAGRMIQIGPEFYNNVLPPIGLGLLAMTSVVPLLQWGAAPNAKARRLLIVSLFVSLGGVVAALVAGVRHPLGLAIVALVTLAIVVLGLTLFDDVWRREGQIGWRKPDSCIAQRPSQICSLLYSFGLRVLGDGCGGIVTGHATGGDDAR